MPEANAPQNNASSSRLGVWFARLGAVAASSFVLLYLTVVVVRGVVSGSIHTISKYSSATISMQAEPVTFWVAVFYHLAISLLISYFAYLGFVGGGWIKRSKQVDTIADVVGSKLPDRNKPLPAWVSIVVLCCFFGFLLAMCAKGSAH